MVARIKHIIEDGVEKKRCCSCNIFLPISEFHANNKKWDGLKPSCKECAKVFVVKETKQKKCTICSLVKDASQFSRDKTKTYGLSSYCRECFRDYKKKQLPKPHKEKSLVRTCIQCGKEKGIDSFISVSKKCKECVNSNKQRSKKVGREKEKAKKKEDIGYRQHFLDRKRKNTKVMKERLEADLIKKAQKQEEEKRRYHAYYHEDEQYRFKRIVRTAIYKALKKGGFSKSSRTATLLGCSYPDLLLHLGAQLSTDAHLDHICPCNQAQNEEELLKLQHYSNLRWLPAEENIQKSDSWTSEGEELCRKLLGRGWIYES